MNLAQLELQMEQLFQEFLSRAHFQKGDVIVIGCSTSEVGGEQIGKAGNPDIAGALFPPLAKLANEQELYLAFQCCEHLNRALVVSKAAMMHYGWNAVTVVPHPHAGGSLASHAFRHLPDAVVVEAIQAQGGLDIGETLIGMHLKPVAVPIRLSSRVIGNARLNAAITRPKLIGGERAKYCL